MRLGAENEDEPQFHIKSKTDVEDTVDGNILNHQLLRVLLPLLLLICIIFESLFKTG